MRIVVGTFLLPLVAGVVEPAVQPIMRWAHRQLAVNVTEEACKARGYIDCADEALCDEVCVPPPPPPPLLPLLLLLRRLPQLCRRAPLRAAPHRH